MQPDSPDTRDSAQRFMSDMIDSIEREHLHPQLVCQLLGFYARQVIQSLMEDNGMDHKEATLAVMQEFMTGMGAQMHEATEEEAEQMGMVVERASAARKGTLQ